jgi:hypothetical protein
MGVNAFHEKAGRSQVDSSLAWLNKVFVFRRVAAVAMLASALSESDHFARCTLGVLGSAGAAICLAPCGSALGESNLGQAIHAVTGTRLWAFVFSLPGTILILFCLFVLRGCCDCGLRAIVQRFVHLSAHP